MVQVRHCRLESDTKLIGPHGSILGHVLFIIYINDLTNKCPILNCMMYADKTTLYSVLKIC